jgi:hypothetical protein
MLREYYKKVTLDGAETLRNWISPVSVFVHNIVLLYTLYILINIVFFFLI